MPLEEPGPMTLGQSAGASDPPPESPAFLAPGSSPSPTLTPVSTGPATKNSTGIHTTLPKEAWNGGDKRPPGLEEAEVISPPAKADKEEGAEAETSCSCTWRAICRELADWWTEFFGGEHLDEFQQALLDMLPEMVVDLADGEDENEEEDVHQTCMKLKALLTPDHKSELLKVDYLLTPADAPKGRRKRDLFNAIDHFDEVANNDKLVREVIALRDRRLQGKKLGEPSGVSGSLLGTKLFGNTTDLEPVKLPQDESEQGLMNGVDGVSTPGKATPVSTPGKTPKLGKLTPTSPAHLIWIEEGDEDGTTHVCPSKVHLNEDEVSRRKKVDMCKNPECNNEFLDGSKFCRKCGTKRMKKEELIFDAEQQKIIKRTDDMQEIVTEHKIISDTHRFPWFIVCWTVLIFGLWLGCALFQDNGEENVPFWDRMAGLESFAFATGYTNLQLVDDTNCGDLRWEIWRLVTYQFTHIGFPHVASNSCINIIFGWRLEKLHSATSKYGGPLLMFFMYNLGVIGGALFFFMGVVHGSVVGMSAGCYSLLGMHAAYLFLNWRNKRRRHKYITLFVLIAWLAIDVLLYIRNTSTDDDTADGAPVSYVAHLGGFVTGVFLAFSFGENIEETEFEQKLKYFSFILLVLALIFCIVWILPTFPPSTIVEPNLRWCWMRHVYNRTHFGDSSWHCVRCRRQACIDSFQPPTQQWASQVTRTRCNAEGWAYTEN
mmetsp:Transcript_101822/g.180595  ORF Transcript_101822/g.180595 Transcript_101822/m.180595 type:complete len:715 (+) Transcript_101822:187-2331(+)